VHGLASEPGVQIVRRDVLRMSVGALGVLLLGGCATRRLAAGTPLPVAAGWDEFVGDLVPRAEALLAQRMDEEAYVADVVRSLRRVDPALVPSTRDLPRHALYAVTEFDFAGGSGFRHHDHRNYNGVIYVLGGHLHCRNFDVVGADRTPAAGRPLRIRETASVTAGTGHASTLTSTRDNVHQIRAAADGARLLDLFTWVGPDPRSVFLDVGRALEPGVWEASFSS
jgi:hypothetical protein